MASRTTYLIVSNTNDVDAVQSHPFIEEQGFELQERWEGEEDVIPSLKFVLSRPLEETPGFEEPTSNFSSAFPDATVILCEVEERFNQIDHLQTVVFIDGQRAGEFEQGYILNVGS